MPRSVPTTTLVVVIGAVIVVLLAVAVSMGLTDPIDRTVIEVVRSDALTGVLSPLRWVTELGSWAAITVVAVGTLLVGLAIGPWFHGVAGAVTIGLVAIGNEAFKAFIARTRPDFIEPVLVERGFSFPSGHALLSTVAYGILGVLISRSMLPRGVRTGALVVLAVGIFLIGLSRVWLGVHFPSDVLAGWSAGAVIVVLFARITRSVSPEPIAAVVASDPAVPRSGPPGRD
ncbi:MAG: phosphatase PAP2 family protein [Candidatus Limnocylindria bacterium]